MCPLDKSALRWDDSHRYASAPGLHKRRITGAEASFHLTKNPYLASCTVCGKSIERRYAYLSGRCFRCRDVAIPIDDNPKQLPQPSFTRKPQTFHHGSPTRAVTLSGDDTRR